MACLISDCPAPAVVVLESTDLGLTCHSRLLNSRELETQIWHSLTLTSVRWEQPHNVTRKHRERNLDSSVHVTDGNAKNSGDDVRGLCIATGQYSSFCVCALVFVLGGFDHMEDDDQDKRDVENGEKVETHKREEEVKQRETKNAQTRVDMWMKMFFMRHALRHLEPQCGVNTCAKVHEKMCSVRMFCSHPRRLQWIAVNCKRNQL